MSWFVATRGDILILAIGWVKHKNMVKLLGYGSIAYHILALKETHHDHNVIIIGVGDMKIEWWRFNLIHYPLDEPHEFYNMLHICK